MYPIWRDAYGQLEVSIGYRVIDNVKISLKGINMTDEVTSGYTMDPSFPLWLVGGSAVSKTKEHHDPYPAPAARAPHAIGGIGLGRRPGRRSALARGRPPCA
jgi:hypothetical protein